MTCVEKAEQRRAALTMFAAGILWGSSGTIARLAPQSASALGMAWTRMFFGAVFMAAALLACGKGLKSLKSPFSVLAGAPMAAFQICFFPCLVRLGVALGTMLSLGSSLIMAGALGFLLGERPSKLWWFAAFVGIAGSSLLSSSNGFGSFDLVGLLLGLGAGVSYALIGLVFKLMDKKRFGPLERNAMAFFGEAILLLPIMSDMAWLATFRGLSAGAAIGLAATAVPYCMFAYALAHISVGQAFRSG